MGARTLKYYLGMGLECLLETLHFGRFRTASPWRIDPVGTVTVTLTFMVLAAEH